MLTLKESIPLTALTEATLVGKRPHSRFGLTGLTGLTLSDRAGHDLFVMHICVPAQTLRTHATFEIP